MQPWVTRARPAGGSTSNTPTSIRMRCVRARAPRPPAEVVNHPFDPALGGGEIEQDTINRYLNLGLTYRPNAEWAANRAGALRDPRPLDFWRAAATLFAGRDRARSIELYGSFAPGRHQTHRQLSGHSAHAQPRPAAGREAAHRGLWHRRQIPHRSEHRRHPSMPACNPAPAAPTSSWAPTTSSPSARTSTPLRPARSSPRWRIGRTSPAMTSVPVTR